VSLASKYGKAPVARAVPMFERRHAQTPQFDNRKFRTLASAAHTGSPSRTYQHSRRHTARTWANKVQRPVYVWDCGDFFALSPQSQFPGATKEKNRSHTWPHRISA
jgi:hypothetical protein